MSKNQNDSNEIEEDECEVGQDIEIIDITNQEMNDEDELANDMNEAELDEYIEDEEGEEDYATEAEFVEDPNFKDDSISTIKKHQAAVFCLDTFNNYLASGGEDDIMCLWSYCENGSVVEFNLEIESEKFKDSVTNVKFSHDGKFLAACDMAGNIRVYLIESKSIHWSYELETDIEMVDWHPSCNVLFASTSDGQFFMFKISTNEIKVMYSGDDTSLSCFKILKDGKRAICCYNNGTIRFWDLKSSQATHSIAKAHQGDIICMDMNPEGNLIATGGTDMKINLINTTNEKLIATLKCDIQQSSDSENSIESLKFCPTLPLIACATLNGQIFVWDTPSQTLRNKLEHASGFTKLLWGKHESLYVSSLDGFVYVYDGRNMKLHKKITCHQFEVLDFCVSTNAELIFTSSNDKSIKSFSSAF